MKEEYESHYGCFGTWMPDKGAIETRDCNSCEDKRKCITKANESE